MTAAHAIGRWRADPVAFVRDAFGVEPDPWQEKVLRAFAVDQKVAMAACKGPGKTCVEAWCIWNFLATRPHPKVIATSVTGDNLSDNLWPELAKWQKRNEFLDQSFRWTKTRIFHTGHPETWFCSARSWPKDADQSQQAEALAGVHADYVLFVLDEAGGVPDAVAVTAEAALASGIETKMLIAGNTSHLEGPLYRACTTEADKWTVVHITSDPDDPERTPRVSREWAADMIARFGREHDWVKVNVLGQFPSRSLNQLLGPEEIQAAQGRFVPETDYLWAPRIIGVDVARFGDDSTILCPRQGLVCFPMVEMRGADTGQIATRVAQGARKWKADAIFVDGTGGYGAGVVDRLRDIGWSPVEVPFSGKAADPQYFNLRSEMWFKMADWVKRPGSLPADLTLAKELMSPTYRIHGDRFRLEEKDEIKKRLGFSPDRADALALTFAQEVEPVRHPVEDRHRRDLMETVVPDVDRDYHPFDRL